MEEKLKKIIKQLNNIKSSNFIYFGITIIYLLIIANNLSEPSIKVTWKNDIHNPSNTEFVNEVLFNLNDTLVITNLDYTLQVEFCRRYYNTLDNKTKKWFNRNNK